MKRIVIQVAVCLVVALVLGSEGMLRAYDYSSDGLGAHLRVRENGILALIGLGSLCWWLIEGLRYVLRESPQAREMASSFLAPTRTSSPPASSSSSDASGSYAARQSGRQAG